MKINKKFYKIKLQGAWDRTVIYLNGLWVLSLCFVILMAFGIQALARELPCPICYLQRIGMIIVATGPLLNLHFGVRVAHYGLSFLASLLGGAVSFWQMSLHKASHFYFLTFMGSLFFTLLLLLLFRPSQKEVIRPLSRLTKLATVTFVVIFLGTLVSTYFDVGGLLR